MYFWQQFPTYGDAIALIEGERKISYQELADKLNFFGQRLNTSPNISSANVNKKILLLGIDNTIETIVAYYAALSEGYVVIVCDNNNQVLRENLKDSLKPHFEYFNIDGVRQLQALPGGVSSEQISTDLAVLISTSGSTGSAKCVRLSFENLSDNTQSICNYLNISQEDNAALILPIHYCYGLSVLNTHLSKGATVHVGDLSVASADFIDYLAEHDITSVAGVPYTYEILERASFRNKSLPKLRYMTQAGGRLAPELVKKYTEWALHNDKEFFVMYGQTEATARMAYLPQDKLRAYPDSIGIAIDGGEFLIKNEQGHIITEANVAGELVYKGKNVMMGYANNASDLIKNNEYTELSTGDVAYKNEEGLFFIVGRLKRFTKIYGKRFNLDEIECAISTLGITAVCVSDDKNLYVCMENTVKTDILQYIQETYGIARQNVFSYSCEEFPLLATGKVDYQKILSEAIQKKELSDSCDGTKKNHNLNTKQRVLLAYKECLKNENIQEQDSFSAIGGDSISYVSLSVQLESILGVLPNNWQSLNIHELSKLQTEEKKYAQIDIDILLRVYAVIAVVCHHGGVWWVKGGAALLLVLSGYNYSRFQLDHQINGKLFKVFSSFFLNVLLPAWCVLIGYSVLRYNEFYWPDVLLYSNNIVSDYAHSAFGVWFLQALIQSIAIFTLPLFFVSIREKIKSNKFFYVTAIFLFACCLRILDEYNEWGKSLSLGGEQISWVLWLFALGALIESANKVSKIWLSILVFITCVGFYSNDVPRMINLIVGILLVLWIGKVYLPRFFVPLVQISASSSLFIYMLHPRAPLNLFDTPWEVDVVRIGFGLILGVVAYVIYNQSIRFFLKQYQRYFQLKDHG